ncbi:type VI secretion system baseplate subunit TssE [Massilia oculi]|uniref:Type VI secretion system baseplate subunit TssE n=1 Tax=Massilia oculi TaxID=945844 RepID=A0A2S2DG18_9BURK|nr:MULTISPECIES: type VI secretion system baseplate subunit TssE [Massilia]AWL04333.1 type VI secretion system baseplate subunit TssE [Massilia oculi]MDY0974768.1 type VI secretion system baseplate subunit TssE [Massilia sp. CFBP9012]
MAELAPRERLQPSLLDRLTDHEPDQAVETRERRVLSERGLRAGVLRDLAWLLNTTNLEAGGAMPRLPHLAGSVLNYGLPDIAGVSQAGMSTADLERAIRQAIWDFEPRLIRASVSVKAVAAPEAISKITFEIEADLWAQPYPEHLYLKTELDLDLRQLTLLDRGALRP